MGSVGASCHSQQAAYLAPYLGKKAWGCVVFLRGRLPPGMKALRGLKFAKQGVC